MDIEILTRLRDYPDDGRFTNVPLPLEEIQQLEILYNGGNPFPKVIRELLYLAGNFCYVLDYGIKDSRQEMQEMVREYLAEENKVITRPFFAVDVYNGPDQCLFVYLDENSDDPALYECMYYEPEATFISKSHHKFSDLINIRISLSLEGLNPF